MQSGQKQVVLGKGEKERRERRKEKRKRKKRKKKKNEKKEKEKEKERKEKKGWWGKETNQKAKQNKKKNHGGVSSDSVYFKSLCFPWKLSVSLAGLLGEGPAVLIFRC